MIAKTTTAEKLSDRIILRRLEAMPEQCTIYNTSMKVIWGMVAVKLGDMKEMIYQAGSAVTIPARTSFGITNLIDNESTILMVRNK